MAHISPNTPAGVHSARGGVAGEQSVVGQNGKGVLKDCGTAVALKDVSPSGEVIIGSAVRDRASKQCGSKPNFNRWRYYGVAPDGAQREILSLDAKVRGRFRVFDGGWEGSDNTARPFLGVRTFFQTAKAKNATLASTFLNDTVMTTDFMDGMYSVDPRPPAWLESFEKAASDPVIVSAKPDPTTPSMFRFRIKSIRLAS